jgi:hypothetical protein
MTLNTAAGAGDRLVQVGHHATVIAVVARPTLLMVSVGRLGARRVAVFQQIRAVELPLISYERRDRPWPGLGIARSDPD